MFFRNEKYLFRSARVNNLILGNNEISPKSSPHSLRLVFDSPFAKTCRLIQLSLAVLETELNFTGEFQPREVDYSNPQIAYVLDRYLSLDPRQINSEIKKASLGKLGWLPAEKRRKILCDIR